MPRVIARRRTASSPLEPHCRRGRASSSPGFTFVEIAIVVLIAGILLSVAYPKWVAHSADHRARAAARRIAHELRLASTRADSISQPILVEFLPASSEYRVQGWTNPDHPDAEYRVSLANAHGATVVAASFGGEPSVTFNGFGIPSAAGSVTVQAGNAQASVSMDAAGRVTAP